MENKLEKLTQKLYEEGLSKGRSEAEKVLADARAEADKIVADAKEAANKILNTAKMKSEELEKNTRTEVTMASKQAFAALKNSIAEMIIVKSAGDSVKSANLDPAFIKDMLLAIAKGWSGAQGGKVSLEALLPADKKAIMDKALEASASEVLAAGIDVKYSNSVESGFKVSPKDGGFYVSFADADFDALLSDYLRPKAAEILFRQ
jgi:V/A-type H+-transporting ATPase subunit E